MPFLEQIKLQLRKKIYTEGRFLILDVEIAGENFINLYNPNTESKQIKTFKKLFSNIKLLNLDERSRIVCTGHFNLFFNSQLETDGRNPSFKSKSVSKFHEISENLDLCDIWRVRNRDKKKDSLSVKNIFLALFKEDLTIFLSQIFCKNQF